MYNDLELRRSQIVYPFGVGAIVDFPNDSLMTCSIDLWGEKGKRIYDPRFQNWLGINHFRVPPSKEESKVGVPFKRFPEWRFCSKCRKLKPLKEWEELYKENYNRKYDNPECYTCNLELIPMRFITVCKNGHVSDFPWEKWVHEGGNCFESLDLRFKTNPNISGLEGIIIECDEENGCGAKRTMAGSFSENIHEKFGGCKGEKPWLGSRGIEYTDDCEAKSRTVQKGGSNVYFPNVRSSILIPPFSNEIFEELEKNDLWHAALRNKEKKELYLEDLADQLNIELKYLEELYNRRIQKSDREKTEINYKYDEYKAFLNDNEMVEVDSNNFEIKEIKGCEYNIKALNKVVLVKRLREIRCLTSFSRLAPVSGQKTPAEEFHTESNAVKISENDSVNWLPAIEVRGEGIFLEFDNDMIENWESNKQVEKRMLKINQRISKNAREKDINPRLLPPKFILLHTLAHLLIRQLNFECGYSSAALKERLYCNTNDVEPNMSGILIYTSSGDSEGTLGGLVKQGNPSFLNNIFKKALKKAEWCSLDPLCIESDGQGLNSLNLAACHGCVLLPETSCEEFNRYLDRGLLIGLYETKFPGFFD